MPSRGDRGNPNYSRADPTRVAQYLTNVSDWAAAHAGRIADVASIRSQLGDDDVWEGLEFHETDTQDLYRYLGGAWHLWERSRTAFTPVWTGFVIGNGTQDASYSISNGRDLHLEVAVKLGSTSAMVSSPTLQMPAGITLVTVSGAYRFPVGWAMFRDQSDADTGDRYGVSTIASATSVNFRPLSQQSVYLDVDGPTATIPHPWAAGDEFMGNIHSFIALQ